MVVCKRHKSNGMVVCWAVALVTLSTAAHHKVCGKRERERKREREG